MRVLVLACLVWPTAPLRPWWRVFPADGSVVYFDDKIEVLVALESVDTSTHGPFVWDAGTNFTYLPDGLLCKLDGLIRFDAHHYFSEPDNVEAIMNITTRALKRNIHIRKGHTVGQYFVYEFRIRCSGPEGIRFPGYDHTWRIIYVDRDFASSVLGGADPFFITAVTTPAFQVAIYDPRVSHMSAKLMTDHTWSPGLLQLVRDTIVAHEETRAEEGDADDYAPPVIIDCGANLGTFSLLSAAAGARVIALEPLTRNMRLTKATFKTFFY